MSIETLCQKPLFQESDLANAKLFLKHYQDIIEEIHNIRDTVQSLFERLIGFILNPSCVDITNCIRVLLVIFRCNNTK